MRNGRAIYDSMRLFSFRRNLFIVSLQYQVPLSEVDQHLPAHRDFLRQHYEKNIFVASGAKIPRTGGVIIATIENKQHLEAILKQDPFYQNKIATYEITEFKPLLYSDDFKCIAEKDRRILEAPVMDHR